MNGIIVVDKPEGFTSHDVVAKLRRICGTRRIGHSGTLDPMATGVLPIFVGRATRACEFAASDEKAYTARLLLGKSTDSQDITGTVLRECDVTVTEAEVLGAVARFVGDIEQIPPMYSAVKVDGKRLYQLARKGVEVERKARKITVYSIGVTRISHNRYDLDIHCSKGTYVRTLCSDIGDALGCGGTLEALRRTRSGEFALNMSHTLEEIAENPESVLLPVDSMFRAYPEITLNQNGVKRCKNGALVPADAVPGQCYRVYDGDGNFLMLASGISDGTRTFLKTVKSFFEVDTDEK